MKGAGARGGDGGERAKQQQENTPRVRRALVDLATVLLRNQEKKTSITKILFLFYIELQVKVNFVLIYLISPIELSIEFNFVKKFKL